MPAGDRRLRPFLYFATNHDWFGYHHFYQGLARQLAASRTVIYVGAPAISWLGFPPRSAVQEVMPRLRVITPGIPRGARFQGLRPARDRRVVRAAVAALGDVGYDVSDCLVWTFTTDAWPLMGLKGTPSVYWTGDEVTDPMEARILTRTNHVFAVSPAAADEKRKVVGSRVRRMPMATDPLPYETAAASGRIPDDLARLPRPIFGYGGAISDRVDWDLVYGLARRTNGSVVFVGPPTDEVGRAHSESPGAPNVHFLGHRDLSEAPNYVAAFDVGLIPYRLSDFNLGANPTKAYDYLASGIPVVATALPALAEISPPVILASHPDSFVTAALEQAATDAASERARRQEVARAHSYEALVRQIDEVLGEDALLP